MVWYWLPWYCACYSLSTQRLTRFAFWIVMLVHVFLTLQNPIVCGKSVSGQSRLIGWLLQAHLANDNEMSAFQLDHLKYLFIYIFREYYGSIDIQLPC